MSSPVVLGLDTGFANIGYAVVQLGKHPEQDRLLDIGHFQTEKASGKRKDIRASEDNIERARQIASSLNSVISEWPSLNLVTYEAMSLPRNASVAAKIGMCFGVLAATIESSHLPAQAATPQEIKKSVAGDKSATKEAIQTKLLTKFPNAKDMLKAKKLAASKHEHPFDALGSIVACYQTDIMRMLRQQVKP